MAQARRGGVVGTLLWLIILIGIAAGAAGWWGWREATRPGPLGKATTVLLAPGSSVSAVGAALENAGAIRDRRLFWAVVRAHRLEAKLRAGEYAVPAGASLIDVVHIVVSGKSILHQLTAPEGLTTAQILRLVSVDPFLAGDVTLQPNEGELLPETYSFTRGMKRDDLIRVMMNDERKLLDALWPARAEDLPFATPGEAVTLASIVEKETARPDERPRIAAVYVNRLRKHMRLESDPAVIYGLTKGEPLGRPILASELKRVTPYNTYLISGLPPTPIANPGRASIEAVLHPLETDEIFFVADGSGGHAFSSTLAEHNRNVAKWRKVEAAQK